MGQRIQSVPSDPAEKRIGELSIPGSLCSLPPLPPTGQSQRITELLAALCGLASRDLEHSEEVLRGSGEASERRPAPQPGKQMVQRHKQAIHREGNPMAKIHMKS